MRHIPYLIPFFFIIIIGCTTTNYSPEDYPFDMVRFGSGGGVTGMVKTYCLLDNGKLYLVEKEEFLFIKEVPKTTSTEVFSQIKKMKTANRKVQRPGNMYHFIEYQGEEGTYRLAWGDYRYKPDPDLISLYDALVKATQKE